MSTEINYDDFELVLLPGKCPPPEFKEKHAMAYKLWREVWLAAYKLEMHQDDPLYSDDFTRQDEIVTLFYKGECACLFFNKWVNGSEESLKDDTYFKCWPETAIKALRKQGDDIIVCCQITLNFKFRRGYLGLSWKDLITGLIQKRFEYSGSDAMTGTMRLSKGMGNSTYKTGSTPILKNHHYSGEEYVDLVVWYKGVAHDSTEPGIAPLVTYILEEKTIALVRPLIKNNKEVKRAA